MPRRQQCPRPRCARSLLRRTEEPGRADLFYVPAAAHAAASNTGDPRPQLRRALAHVAAAHPFFNRSGVRGGRAGRRRLPPLHACFRP